MDDRVEPYSASSPPKTGVARVNYACCDRHARPRFARSPPAIRAAQYARIAPYGRHILPPPPPQPARAFSRLLFCHLESTRESRPDVDSEGRPAALQHWNTNGTLPDATPMGPRPQVPGPQPTGRRWRPTREPLESRMSCLARAPSSRSYYPISEALRGIKIKMRRPCVGATTATTMTTIGLAFLHGQANPRCHSAPRQNKLLTRAILWWAF